MTLNINPYIQVLENMRRSEPLVAHYSDGKGLHVLQADVAGRIEKSALHILIYGAYNAGKSTLINVLLGEARARVGDIPTTDRVDTYDWNGYRLLDTPGVNAPIRHEQVTTDQLVRTNAVVLVIREGDQDVMDVYNRLFSMMKNKKTIFIILNHQLGSADEVMMSSKRIGDVFSQLAADYGVHPTEAQALPIYPVNLNTALNGSMRRHARLIEHSGFTQFLESFADWTRRQDNEHHHLSEIKDTVKFLWYDPVIHRLKELTGAGDGGEADELRDLERTLVDAKDRLHTAAYSMVDSEVVKIRSDIAELIRDPGSKEEVDERLERVLQPLLERIERWLSEELEGGSGSIDVSVEAPQMSEDLAAHTNTAARDILVEQLGKVGDAVTNKDFVKEVLLRLRGMKKFGIRDVLRLKGKWTKTLDKGATKFTRRTKVGLSVAQGLVAAWDAHKQEQKENQEMRRHAVESSHSIDSICAELRRDLVGAIDAVIEEGLGGAIVRIREQLADIATDSSEKDKHYQELLDHRSELQGITFTTTRTGAPRAEPAVGT